MRWTKLDVKMFLAKRQHKKNVTNSFERRHSTRRSLLSLQQANARDQINKKAGRNVSAEPAWHENKTQMCKMEANLLERKQSIRRFSSLLLRTHERDEIDNNPFPNVLGKIIGTGCKECKERNILMELSFQIPDPTYAQITLIPKHTFSGYDQV